MAKFTDHDDYIASAPEFARPILEKIRALVHKACGPGGATESIKWNVPWFEHEGLILGMAYFKAHASFGFWRAKEMDDPHGLFERAEGSGGAGKAGGKRGGSMCTVKFSSVDEMPSDRVLLAYFRQAVKLNETSKPPSPKKHSKSELKVPASITDALKTSKKAQKVWDGFGYSHQLEYIIWIRGAKKDETRERRLKQMVEMLEEGKSRNWKYDPRENPGHAKAKAVGKKKTTKKKK